MSVDDGLKVSFQYGLTTAIQPEWCQRNCLTIVGRQKNRNRMLSKHASNAINVVARKEATDPRMLLQSDKDHHE